MKNRALVFALASLLPCAIAHGDQPPSASPPPVANIPVAPPPSSAPPTATASVSAPPPPAPPVSPAPPTPSASVSGAPSASTPPVAALPPPTTTVDANAATKASAPLLPAFLVAAEVGVQHLSIAALKGSDASFLSIDGAPTATLLGAAAAYWLRPFTFGLRVHFAHTSLINYWNVGPEVGVRFPVAGVEPYGFVGLGYASVAGLGHVLNQGPQGAPTSGGSLGAGGYDARLGLGLDLRLTPIFSVGGLVAAEIVHLGYSVDGASVDATTTGLATSASIVLGAAF